jgi:hypothetical protein
MPSQYKNIPMVSKIENALPEIAELLKGKPGEAIPQENIQRLYTISTELVLGIERG